jgi:hypothetical protein
MGLVKQINVICTYPSALSSDYGGDREAGPDMSIHHPAEGQPTNASIKIVTELLEMQPLLQPLQFVGFFIFVLFVHIPGTWGLLSQIPLFQDSNKKWIAFSLASGWS